MPLLSIALPNKKLKFIPVFCVTLFFLTFLAIGLFTCQDYGVSWDEPQQLAIGTHNYTYMRGYSEELLSFKDRYYGPLFEVALVAGAKLFRLRTSDAIYAFRHLINFLFFFVGVFVFYLLLRYQFKSWKVGLVGCLLLILSPRIYADAFYNSKDIPFLVLFLVGIATLILYLDHPQPIFAGLHGLICAAAIAVRMPGVFLPAMTIGFWFLDNLFNRKKNWQMASILVYLLMLMGCTTLFYPILWGDPLQGFMEAFNHMAHYQWRSTVLFEGQFIDVAVLPWYYLPLWILISTPIGYTVFMLTGLVFGSKQLAQRPILQFTRERRNLLLSFVYFFGPLLAIIAGRAIVYDGWRHVFFIYPAFIIFVVYGILGLYRWLREKLNPKWVNASFFTIIAVQFLFVANFMVVSHPYQNVYFNRLGGASLAEAKAKYEFDYWGLSYREGLQYILRTDPGLKIPVLAANSAVVCSSFLLAPEEQDRLAFVQDESEASYFIGNYRHHPDEYPYPNRVYSVQVFGASLTSVFKLR